MCPWSRWGLCSDGEPSPTGHPRIPRNDIVKKVLRALDQISKDSTLEDTDAGPDDAPTPEKASPFAASPEPEGIDVEADGGLLSVRTLPRADAQGGRDKYVVVVDVEDHRYGTFRLYPAFH